MFGTNRPRQNDRKDHMIISCLFVKNVIFCVFTSQISLLGVPPLFSFSLIINSFQRDLMWEALIFSKEIVLVFSKVGASRRIRPHIRPPYLRWAIEGYWSSSGRVYLLFLE